MCSQGVEGYYEQALAIEPNGIEVLAQFAQYKNMVSGDFQGAVDMLKKAVPLSRSRDEALELCQVKGSLYMVLCDLGLELSTEWCKCIVCWL